MRLAARIIARLHCAPDDRLLDVFVVDPDTATEPVHVAARAGGLLPEGCCRRAVGIARQWLTFLLETVLPEAEHPIANDARPFALPFTPARVATLRSDAELSERLDAFVARFARLQDKASDKLLPALLSRFGTPVGSALDDLDRAARLGWLLQSSETRPAARTLRKCTVREYIRKPEA